MPNDWAADFAQESERARSLAQRGMLLTGTSVVTVGVLFQSLAALAGPTVASLDHEKFTLLLALLCLVVAAVTGAVTIANGPAESRGVYSGSDTDVAAARVAALKAARERNDRNTTALTASGWAEVAGMLFVAASGIVYVFKL
jgi:hypothetical protein